MEEEDPGEEDGLLPEFCGLTAQHWMCLDQDCGGESPPQNGTSWSPGDVTRRTPTLESARRRSRNIMLSIARNSPPGTEAMSRLEAAHHLSLEYYPY